jgi:carbon-monoxide dehydrogenase large subunit
MRYTPQAFLTRFNVAPQPPSMNLVRNACGVYRIPLFEVSTKVCFTNTSPVSAYRGAGRPEANMYIERLIDEAAREMKIDRVELRRKNLIPASAMPFKTGLVFTYDCGEFARGMEMALRLADHAGFEKRRLDAQTRGRLRGFGIANPIEVAGGPYTAVNPDTSEVRVNADGSVSVFAGSTSMGQGNETAFTQIVCDRLGVPPERVQVFWGDSDALGAGRGNGGSGALTVGGSAVTRATEKIIERGRRIAAKMLEAAPDDVRFADGKFSVAGTDKGVAWAAVAKTAYTPRQQPEGMEPGFSETAAFTPPAVTFPNGTHVCEVEIDGETGAVGIVRYAVVDDVGRMVNPMLVKGQIHGGIVQGLGQGLFEDLTYDPATGQLLAATFMDYAMPRAEDVPGFDVDAHEVPTQVNPLGAKGVGEAGTVGALPALLNAVNDALAPLGVRHLDMPVTPARVWRAIREASVKPPR